MSNPTAVGRSPPSDYEGDQGTGPTIIGVTWTLTVLCLLVLSARLYARQKLLSKWLPEDWIMLLAGSSHIYYQITVTINFRWGLGKPMENLIYDPQIKNIIKWSWLGFIANLLVFVLSRISVGLSLVHIFGTKRAFKWFVYVVTALEAVVSILVVFAVLFRIQPFQGTWDKSIRITRVMNINFLKYSAYLSNSLALLMDVTFVFWPIAIIWNLNMPLRRRIGLCVLLAMSLATLAAGLARVVVYSRSINLTEVDLQAEALVIVLSAIESSFVIIMGSAPAMPSFFELCRLQFLLLSSSLRKANNSGHGSRSNTSLATAHDHSAYLNIDSALQGMDKYGTSNDALIVNGRLQSHFRDGISYDLEASNSIIRTCQFSVTYEQKDTARTDYHEEWH
ncbi:hypothetical protein F5Y19DRAFT_474053 [Xylariaceae sp. FL1651]|nr:hypothetical protein F5Y19DRAFT_474053 [Xylariaceae sp. FL1651]